MGRMDDGHAILAPLQRRVAEPYSFIWMGKTGGNAVRFAARRHNRWSLRVRFVIESHQCRLIDLPTDRKYFFSVRHPIDRFYSGFYSRKREGRPKNNAPHSADEAKYFAMFQDANDLAEALDAGNHLEISARAALQAIMHVKDRQADYFSDYKEFLETRPPIFILRQEHLASDLVRLWNELGIGRPQIPSDPVTAHVNPSKGQLPNLSQRAKANLEIAYREDIKFFKKAMEFGESKGWYSSA